MPRDPIVLPINVKYPGKDRIEMKGEKFRLISELQGPGKEPMLGGLFYSFAKLELIVTPHVLFTPSIWQN
jgi:hypothetical protein